MRHHGNLIKESLNIVFKSNFHYYVHKDTKERTVPMKSKKKIDQNVINIANEIIDTHLNSLETLTQWGINCTLYCIAISCKEVFNDISTPEQQNKTFDRPKWFVNLEKNIERLRTI